jgi:methionyl-tRNA formyltransferase
MRVVLFGYQTWGHRTLEALLASEHDVVLVVTHPASEHPYEQIWNDSVADLAAAHGVPTVVRDRPDEEVARRVKETDPDVIVATNWRTWIPPHIHEMPRHGTLNVHDSLLPAYAGFAPLVWAVINGESEVGVTAHMMTEELDAGDIVLQRAIPVGPVDTSADLFHRTVELFGPITVDGLALISSGKIDWAKQDRSKASFFHKRADEDNRIDWTWPVEDLANLVRALPDPYPNAYTYRGGERIRITAATVSAGIYGGTPGRIFIREGSGDDEGVVIVAGADARRGRNHGLLVQRIRTEDGRDLPATEFFTKMGGYLG